MKCQATFIEWAGQALPRDGPLVLLACQTLICTVGRKKAEKRATYKRERDEQTWKAKSLHFESVKKLKKLTDC